MKSKKFIATLMAAVMLISTLAACGSPSSSSSAAESTSQATGSTAESTGSTAESTGSTAETGDVADEITFWSLSTRQEAIDPMAAAYEESTGKKVTVSYYDTDGIKDACKVAASSGTLPTCWFNWGGALGSFYTDNGCTYDLTAYADENNWSDKYTEASMELCKFNDQLSGIPTSYNVIGIYYRKDIFEQYNLEVPTTLAEFEEVCATLKENGVTPMSTGGLNGWHVMRWVEQLIEYYCGSKEHDSMNTFDTSYDNENVVKALDKYKEWVDKGYFPAGFLTADPNDALTNLYSGSCAMDIEGQWGDGKIITDGQDIANYGVFAFPSNDNGKSRMSAFVEMTQINSNASDAEVNAVVDWMDYYYNDSNVTDYGTYMNQPLPLVGATMPENQPNVPTMIEMSDTNGIFTITDQAFPTAVADVLFSNQDAIANGETDSASAAKAIQAAIDSYVASNK